MAGPESRPRVLMVSERFFPDTGGTERQLQLLAARLVHRGLAVEVVTPRLARTRARHEVIEGIPVHRVPVLRARRLGTATALLSLAWFLLRHARRFDVFHTHTVGNMAVVATLLGRLFGKRIVLKAVGWWELEVGILSAARRSRLDTRVRLAILRHAGDWVAVSPQLRDAMLAAGIPEGRVRLSPNGVDHDRYCPGGRADARRQLGMPGDGPRVVFVGRLVREKGLDTLLRAWRHVVEKVPSAHLDLVGQGPRRGDLEAECRRLEIERSVTFHGLQPDVVRHLQAADCFVLSSTVEGMSNALLEAMAVGLPTVASRIGGTESVLEDRVTGLLVMPDDPDELARAITMVLENPELAATLGQRARARVEQAYGIDRVVDLYTGLYGARRPAEGARGAPTVAYLVSIFPCWSETFILSEILALRARGVPVKIFSLRPPRERLVQEGARELLDEVVYPPSLPRLALAQAAWLVRSPARWLAAAWVAIREAAPCGVRETVKALYTVAMAAHFCRQARRLGVDHVHAHWATYPALAARVMRALTEQRFTFTAHAHDIFLPNPYLGRNIAAAARVVTISDYNRVRLVAAGASADTLAVVPCGLDFRDFAPVRRRRRPGPPLIVAVGRLEAIKGFGDLLEACALLHRRGVEFQCEIVGDGSLRAALEQRIGALGLGDRVRLLGAHDVRTVREILAGATVFALPSVRTPSGDQDGVPVALMEAMATGLPVVTTRVSGIPALVTSEVSGLLVQPGDVEALAAALRRVLADPALGDRLGACAREVVRSRHDIERSVDRLLSMFVEVTDAR